MSLQYSQSQDLAKTLASYLDDSSCGGVVDSKTLARIHARMLRLHLLRLPYHWNSLMRSYLRRALPRSALSLFSQMRRSGRCPDHYTLPLALKACHVSSSSSPLLGLQLHGLSFKLGLHRDECSESGLITLYVKSGEFRTARKVFDENPVRRIGSWNAMINGLTQAGHVMEGFRMFAEMRRAGQIPDQLTMVCVVSACGTLGDLALALQVHKLALQVNCLERLNITLSNSLLDMYCKCGRTDLAHQVFAKMTQRNVSTWTALITGLGTHGQERLALEYFDRMMKEGIQPNHVTMVGVLYACTHGGLLNKGMKLLETMKDAYGVEPQAVHYGCVIDMLGRVGRMKEARELAEKMPMGPNAIVWGMLLGASEKHSDVEVGEWAAKNLIELEPWNDGVYVVLSNIYAAMGIWEEVERMRRVMRRTRVAKMPGYSLPTWDFEM